MPLSIQGQKILALKFESYRKGFIECNPGCNENDVEREFLHLCPSWEETSEGEAKLHELVETIR